MSRPARKKFPPELTPEGPDPHLHAAKCTICRHPQRAEIERAFVDWESPREIAQFFGLRSHTTVYRHARARGLFELRRRNLHFGLGRIAEQVAEVKPSAANVIAAFVAMAKINARGEWDPGLRFNTKQASDHAFWEEDWSAAREIDLEDTLDGMPASIHIAQQNLRQFAANYDVQSAAEAATRAAESAREAEQEKEEAEEAQESEEAQREQLEEILEEEAEPTSQPTATDPPPAPVQIKKQPEPEEERPYPIPRPPKYAPSLEDSGPPQVAGLPWPKRNSAFFRRPWRSPRH
jgi:hypothetical protein